MGLDMFLYKRRKNSKGAKQKEREEICYWRKANAILNWFDHNLDSVRNQGGEDNSSLSREGVRNVTYYTVKKEEYQKLLDDCKKLLENKTYIPADMLPTSGFFFGSGSVDEWFWKSIEHTVTELEKQQGNIDWNRDIVEFYIWY